MDVLSQQLLYHLVLRKIVTRLNVGMALVNLLRHQESAIDIKVAKQGRGKESHLIHSDFSQLVKLSFALPGLLLVKFFFSFVGVPLDYFLFDLKSVHCVFFRLQQVPVGIKGVRGIDDLDRPFAFRLRQDQDFCFVVDACCQ